jgi:CRISPR-associated protein Csd1
MLLQRLVEYAARTPGAKPFHRERQFSWQLNLTADGRLESPELQELTVPDAAGRLRGVAHTVPTMVRTVGVAPNLAADDVQYVLGWVDEETKPERVARCHTAFAELAVRWAESAEGREDSVARAVAAFYRDGLAGQVRRRADCSAKSGVLIAVDGVPAYRAPSTVPFWSAEVGRRKGGGNSGLCLICGQVRPLLDTVPGKVPKRFVPGATNDTALVSVNERVFGYDLTEQLGHTPLCLVCGNAVSAGLVDLLGSPHATSYSGQNARMAWWTTAPDEFDAMAVLGTADPQQVTGLLQSVHQGRQGAGTEVEKFFALTVGGNVARVMVRDWLEMPLAELHRNVARWFDEHAIAPVRREGRRHHGLGRLVLVTGRWLRDRQRYADFSAKGADRPEDVQRDLLRAALRGVPLPPLLLVHVVHRIRTDGCLDDARASLIRLALTRSPLTAEKPMPDLDPSNTNPAYVAGRVFAALEQIQYDVSEGRLNATYGDRYFAGAIANPQAALVNGERDANAWLRKLRRTKPGAAVNHEKKLDALYGLLDAEPPSRTTLREQSLFLLGYHHQRAARFAGRTPAQPVTEETPA